MAEQQDWTTWDEYEFPKEAQASFGSSSPERMYRGGEWWQVAHFANHEFRTSDVKLAMWLKEIISHERNNFAFVKDFPVTRKRRKSKATNAVE